MNLMIDLETLDTSPTAVILSVGIVAFDDEEIHDKLYMVPNMQVQMDIGRTVNASTILWWMEQSAEARKVFDEQKHKSENWFYVLEKVTEFIARYPKCKLYSLGSDFDMVILTDAFLKSKRPLPWFFSKVRCFRTWCDDHDAPYYSSKSPKVSHNALKDAEDQANHMISVKKKIAFAIENAKIKIDELTNIP